VNFKRTAALVALSTLTVGLVGCGTSMTGPSTGVNAAQGMKAAAKATGVKRALMVGINAYQYVSPLSGCINDLVDTKAQVLDKFGFAEANTTTLKDAQATRVNILASLEKLVAESQPGDFLYFHYSGHGAQIPDTNGDEKDGKDEILCPVDARAAGGTISNIIVDDEINTILGKLKTGVGFFMVSDSCNSGTIDQGLERKSRGITLPATVKNVTPLKANLKAMAAFETRVDAGKYTIITGCQENQTSADARINGRWNGALTYCLLETLKVGGAEMSYAAWHRATATELKTRRYSQIPNLLGNGDLKLFSIAK
jgi:hypothetical protein